MRRGKGEGVVEGGTGFSDLFKRTSQANGHHAGLVGGGELATRTSRDPAEPPALVVRLDRVLDTKFARILAG